MLGELIRGKGHSTPKSSMFCGPSLNCQHFFWKIISISCGKLSEKLKNGIKILVGPVVLAVFTKHAKYYFDP